MIIPADVRLRNDLQILFRLVHTDGGPVDLSKRILKLLGCNDFLETRGVLDVLRILVVGTIMLHQQVLSHLVLLCQILIVRHIPRHGLQVDFVIYSLQLPSVPLQIDQILDHLVQHDFHDFMKYSLCLVDGIHNGVTPVLLNIIKAVCLEPFFYLVSQMVSV
jgi:hypothetical protein